jgi:hypothetical protein
VSTITHHQLPFLPMCCAILLGAGWAAPSAFARDQLGPLDNVLIQNPYADATFPQFGSGMVAGDFDGDGVDDLAVSESPSMTGDPTRLRVMRGVERELGSISAQFVSTTIEIPEHHTRMVAGDFDGDGRDEIAVGADGVSGAGVVYVINRATNGTWSVQSEVRAGGAYPGAPQNNASLGASLATGDFDDDGYADLAIGMDGQTVSGAVNAGAVMVTYGSASGIGASGAQLFNRNNDGLTFTPTQDDRFGDALAAGDFDGDDDDDLAIGISHALCPDGTTAAGAVVVLNGSASGITTAQSHIWRPGVQNIAGICANTRRFGQALAAGNFDSDEYVDLAIGAPYSFTTNSAVHVLYGGTTGLSATRDQRFTAPALPGGDPGDDGGFGSKLATGRLAHECLFTFCTGASLVIAAPNATVDGIDYAGAVWIVNGDIEDELDIGSMTAILPRAPLQIGAPHDDDRFGSTLAVGDFNNDDRVDLAIGATGYDGIDLEAGAVQVMYQYEETIFLDAFE